VPEPQKQPKGKFVGLVALIGASAAAILIPTVQSWEGRAHVPYRDIVGIWTVCDGDTKNVVPSDDQSDEECDARLERQLIAHARPVLICTPGLKGKPNATAAAISLAYNIGAANYCRSTVDRRFDAGNVRGACDAFLLWNRAGGQVVRGLERRRHAEREICLRDAG